MIYELQTKPTHEAEYNSYKKHFNGLQDEITHENFGVVRGV